MTEDTESRPVKCIECGGEFLRPVRRGGQAIVCSDACRVARTKTLASIRNLRYREESPETHIERAREWRRANPERAAETERRWRRANPQSGVDAARRFRAANPEKVAGWARRYREANPEAEAERSQRWRDANPEKVRDMWHRRRARKRDALVHDVPESMAWEFNPAGPGVCNYCAVPIAFDDRRAWDIDHVVPLSRGGLHEIGNLVIACVRCNRSKGARLLSEWRAELDPSA